MAYLEVSHIRKKFGEHEVIHDFSYKFEVGKSYAICGPSGCGKTTLLNILGLLEKKDSGTICIMGVKNPSIHSRITNKLLRNEISYLFQNYALIDNETVYKNLMLTLQYDKSNNKKQKIKEALQRCGLHDVMDQKVHCLSGGEQQRVALARLILKPSHIILADEPTGNLDQKNRDEVIAILKAFTSQQKTVIIVTHDEYLALNCDEIIRL